MSKRYFLSFYNKKFTAGHAWLKQSLETYAIDEIISKKHTDFCNTSFYNTHKNVCSEPQGAGLYIWKPYYILEVLQGMQENEVLMYVDSGHVLINDPAPLYELCGKKGIVLFENYQGYPYFSTTGLRFTEEHCYRTVNACKYWCKGDAFELMAAHQYADNILTDASVMLFRKDVASIRFVSEWLQYCTDYRIISRSENETGASDNTGFVFHIYDQSVISLLAAKYELELFRCPSQYGNHYKLEKYRQAGEYLLLPYSAKPLEQSDFNTITYHHRYRQQSFIYRQKNNLFKEMVMANAYLLGNKFNWINKLFKTQPYKAF